ncbi:MAG: hypothetical protein DRJ01_05480 [Bacteroidetes bacterium]|nr:MAG: hypothetical protein DRJ01_05480 [Bacteroidota bacterium]
MKRNLIIVILILFTSQIVSAQENNDILLTIDNHKITKAEFERIYRKNNNIKNTGTVDKKSLDEYLELFINFKLKVYEAEKAGYDTAQSFITELKGYRNQLAKPYFSDKKIEEQLLQEAYNRTKFDIRAAHILIKCNQNALPKDTLIAYNKALNIRKKILKGDDFNKVALANSEDPSVKFNGGDLGYFTAFQMVYPFESAAYNTPVGEVSMPTRTRFGYHLVKVIDKKPNLGQVKVAHIMIAVPKGAKQEVKVNAKKKIFAISDSLAKGVDFVKLVKEFSDDKASAKKNGELPFFGTGKMVPDFEKAAFSLKNIGDISKPVKTSFGWHIIKLIDRKQNGSFEELKPMLKNKISRDARGYKGKKVVISRIKKEYNYKLNNKRLNDFYKVVDKSIFDAHWSIDKAANLNKTIFSIGDTSFNQQDFAKFISKFQIKRKPSSIQGYVNDMYERFANREVLQYAKKNLENKYPDFKYLMKEYHDGILLFKLTDELVWSKAVKDTVGLKKFYQEHKENYKWGERYKGSIYYCANEKIKNKLQKQLNSKKQKDNKKLLEKFNKKSEDNLKIVNGIFSKGKNEIIDFYVWNTGDYKENDKEFIVLKGEKIEPVCKTLNEAKGLITADYQTYLEKEWIESLRKKYKVTVNKEVLYSIK